MIDANKAYKKSLEFKKTIATERQNRNIYIIEQAIEEGISKGQTSVILPVTLFTDYIREGLKDLSYNLKDLFDGRNEDFDVEISWDRSDEKK